MTVNEQLDLYASMTDDFLLKILSGSEMSKILFDSMSYSVFAGGKRLRPALCLGACELLHGDVRSALPYASALEMIHTYSLIHDDLPALDNDSMRRGKPSNHVAFGEANAILAGDGLQALAFETAAASGNVRALAAISRGAFDMVVGQSYDLTESENPDMLMTIHRLKTGAPIRAAVLSGAYCANPTEQEAYELEQFAESFGLLFQITDDILDVAGDAALLGKSVGKDAAAHKLTFVTKFGLDGARAEAETTATAAKQALSGFGERASFFTELVDMTLTRRK